MRIHQRRNRVWWIAGIVVALILVGIFTWALWASYAPKSISTTTSRQELPKPKPVSISSNTLFFGNVYWGRYINDWSMKSDLKTAYPFSRLNEFDRAKYDAWIAGLECPTVAGFTQTSIEEDTTLSFNCNPDYLPEAAKWFTAFTLANNHTDNRGAEGFTETQQRLAANKIQYFGNYDPYVIKDACEVLALPVKVTYDDRSVKPEQLPVALCAYHGVFKIPPADAIAEITKYSQYMPVIVMPHMGKEYVATPDEIKTSTYRAFIDSGADMVLGDHPHWVQTTEAYKGKLIVYSMGNFIFDQQDSTEVTRSAAINVVMKTTNTDTQEIDKWLTLGKTCATFKDDCLSTAASLQFKKLAMQYQYGVVGTDDGGKVVKPANEAQQASILQRLNWQNTMSQLQPPYSSL